MSASVPLRLRYYARLTRLDKPVGTLLLLWPTLAALWIAAAGKPDSALLLIFVAGTFLMRSAGCAINDAMDRNVDAHVERTADRVVTRGLVSASEATAVAAALMSASALLLLALNDASRVLAVAAVALACTYPLFKRFFPVPQLYLGIAFSFGIPMAFAAVQGTVSAIGWWFFFANMFWVLAYDTEYAMVDRDDDVRLGLRSSAVFFGRADVAVVMVSYGAYLGLLLVVGAAIDAGPPFLAGWMAALAIALYHYRLICDRSREGCFRAFRHNAWLGFAVFAGVAADYALR
jgi:4-hydroxybenzoate polyprenyltransferase